jgi:hypothetical protein
MQKNIDYNRFKIKDRNMLFILIPFSEQFSIERNDFDLIKNIDSILKNYNLTIDEIFEYKNAFGKRFIKRINVRNKEIDITLNIYNFTPVEIRKLTRDNIFYYKNKEEIYRFLEGFIISEKFINKRSLLIEKTEDEYDKIEDCL